VPRAPAPRSAHAMAYDGTNKVTLLFGGGGAILFRDLWAWDGRSWSRLANGGPPARDDAILAHDGNRGRTVLFGGRTQGGVLLADTWEWDGAAWSRRNVAGPGGRLHACGAFDPVAGRVRVYGGTARDGRALGDTWEYDGVGWTRVADGPAPRGWVPNGMVFDAARRRMLLTVFDPGAFRPDGTTALELRQWDGREWIPIGAVGPAISPLQATVGPAGGGLLLVDGGALSGAAASWLWSKDGWRRSALAEPSPRNGHALASDPSRGRVVLFGGFRNGIDFDDTWEWDGLGWRRVGP